MFRRFDIQENDFNNEVLDRNFHVTIVCLCRVKCITCGASVCLLLGSMQINLFAILSSLRDWDEVRLLAIKAKVLLFERTSIQLVSLVKGFIPTGIRWTHGLTQVLKEKLLQTFFYLKIGRFKCAGSLVLYTMLHYYVFVETFSTPRSF